MYHYNFDELFNLFQKYNKKTNQNIDINEVLGLTSSYIRAKHDLEAEKPRVLYEDENYYGIYKPPNWIVNVGSTDKSTWDVNLNMDKNLLQVWLYKNLHYPLRTKIEFGYGICNRLDRDTSGIVIVAKDKNSYKYLRKNINEHTLVKKNYITLVRGKIIHNGEIQVKIKCTVIHNRANKCYVNDQGKYAKTYYEVIANLKDKYNNFDYTLLKINIVTGRTHQIRVHMRMLNTYIIGDSIYTKNQENYDIESKLVPRMFLHSYNYSFINQKGKKIEIKSPLPKDLMDSLKENFISDSKLTMPEIINILSISK